MLTLISSWFEQTTAPQAYRRTDYILLGLILAVGVVLRFWGLGNVGLHGDEETMAMPAMAILETGHPYLPSGMYYSRALLNIYMMSGSVLLFGESEWAFRFPSAVVGSLTGLVAFFMGRRFLAPHFNIAFVATIVLLPSLIEISQTARMYVFFVTCLIWFAACLFRWERDQRISSLVVALLVWLLALHFHRLAIFAAPLFLFPGLSRASWKLLIQGAAAFVAGYAVFESYGAWISSKYPQEGERLPVADGAGGQVPLEALMSGAGWIVIASLIVIGVLLALLLYKVSQLRDWRQAIPVVLVGLGLLALAMLQYHIGGLLLLLGVVFWLRASDLPKYLVLAPLALAGLLAVMHLGLLHATDSYPGRKLIGAVIGAPSVWPILRFLQYSPFAGVVYGLTMAVMLVRFSRGRPLPMHFLFFSMAVWVPLLILGFFTWYMPPRYAQGQLGFFLLCAFAGLAYLVRGLEWFSADGRSRLPGAAMLLLVAAALVNPVLFASTVNAGYERHPDHKGAAEYIKNLDLSSDAILIAEDALQQAYYLKDVDYWLRELRDAAPFSVVREGQLYDQYTGARVIGTGDELRAVLDSHPGNEIYIIGSGENFVGDKRLLRGEGIEEVLESDVLETVYEGRDGKTRVWKVRQ